MRATIEQLWRYPVKSMAGERVGALRVDWRGAAGDRTHAVRGERGLLTARQVPGLLRWRASYGDARPDPETPPLPRLTSPDGVEHPWETPALGADLEQDIVFTRALEGQQDLGRSLLITTEASHRALEAELGTEIDLRRFRTNLHLVADAPAWAELELEGATLELEGGVVLRLLHPCVRCVIPTRDPDTAAKWPALLKHLHAEHGTRFGINARVEVPGELREGYSAWTSESTSATEAFASPKSSAVFSA